MIFEVLRVGVSRLRRRFLPRGVEREARRLIEMRQFEAADHKLAAAIMDRPNDAGYLLAYAMSAHVSGRYGLAIDRWQDVIRAAPYDPVGHACLAANFRERGEIARAVEIIAAAEQAFPRDTSIITEAARIAEARGRFAEAARYWGVVVARRRPPPDWIRGYAHALAMTGEFDAAQRVIEPALKTYPDHRGLLAIPGILAYARGDWAEAVANWTRYRARFPDDKTGWEHLGRASEAMALTAAAERPAPALLDAAAIVDTVDDEKTRQLMLGFESVGDSCEFGAVQRRFSAEPLGLLRWNNVPLSGLLAALAARFEGMGEPQNTELSVLDNGEFFIRDRRWDLGMHTFLFAGQTDRDVLHAKMCRRVVYLREKFLADLTAAEKIFVYRSPGLSGSELEMLHRALRGYGPARLLSVQPSATALAPCAGRPGDIQRLDEACTVGFLGRLGVADGGYWDIAYDDWVAVCEKAAVSMALS